MSSEVNLPYVVSADVAGLLTDWAAREQYRAPSSDYLEGLTMELSQGLEKATDSPVVVVSQNELRAGMLASIASCQYPAISLDRAYIFESDPGVEGHIDTTRAVARTADGGFEGIGLHPRPGYPPVNDQLEALKTSRDSPVVLADDVVYEGRSMVRAIKDLRSVNRPVTKVIAGIGIREGIELIEDQGVEVECVRVFETVHDEVCERDFFAGVPMSGRTVIAEDGSHASAPYFEPFGDAGGWASIPQNAVAAFSRLCLELSIDLWAATEMHSRREIPANAIPRRILEIDGPQSVVKSLRKHLDLTESTRR